MKVQRVVVIGAGGMAREVVSAIHSINRIRPEFEFVGYAVTELGKLSQRDSRDQVMGDLDWLCTNQRTIDAAMIGIGSPQLRTLVAEQVAKALPNLSWPSLVHPSAEFEKDSACIGEGVFIGAGFVGTVNLKFEPFALCNFGCTVGHESKIGRGSVINPGANISGGVSIGAEVLIGTGAQVLQYLTVGDGATVGAGAVVTKDVAPGVTVVGMPAKPLNR
jgi:sugar O-acyltransferase (sialic acid O-acetyltransferase NeuD family)